MNREAGMLGQITIADYSSDWALKERRVDPRTGPGLLTREEVTECYGALGIAGIELNHAYWEDFDAARLKQLAANAGLPIVTYVAMVDLAVWDEVRIAAISAQRLTLPPSA